mgnify:CR=1 FL=1
MGGFADPDKGSRVDACSMACEMAVSEVLLIEARSIHPQFNPRSTIPTPTHTHATGSTVPRFRLLILEQSSTSIRVLSWVQGIEHDEASMRPSAALSRSRGSAPRSLWKRLD